MNSDPKNFLNHAKAVQYVSTQLTKRCKDIFGMLTGEQIPLSYDSSCQNFVNRLLQAGQSYAFFQEQGKTTEADKQKRACEDVYQEWLDYQQKLTDVEPSITDGMVERTKAEIERKEAKRASLGWFGQLLNVLFPM